MLQGLVLGGKALLPSASASVQDVLVTSWIATVFENDIRDMPSSLLSSLESSCKLPAEQVGQGPALVIGTLDVNQGGRPCQVLAVPAPPAMGGGVVLQGRSMPLQAPRSLQRSSMGGSLAPGHTLAMYAQLLQCASGALLQHLWAQLQSMRPAMPSAICMSMWRWTTLLPSVSISSVGLWWSSRSLLVLHGHFQGQRAACCTGSCSTNSSPALDRRIDKRIAFKRRSACVRHTMMPQSPDLKCLKP